VEEGKTFEDNIITTYSNSFNFDEESVLSSVEVGMKRILGIKYL